MKTDDSTLTVAPYTPIPYFIAPYTPQGVVWHAKGEIAALPTLARRAAIPKVPPLPLWSGALERGPQDR